MIVDCNFYDRDLNLISNHILARNKDLDRRVESYRSVADELILNDILDEMDKHSGINESACIPTFDIVEAFCDRAGEYLLKASSDKDKLLFSTLLQEGMDVLCRLQTSEG